MGLAAFNRQREEAAKKAAEDAKKTKPKAVKAEAKPAPKAKPAKKRGIFGKKDD